jgi:hypothetical protein
MSAVSSPAYAYLSRGDHIHGHCPPVDSILCRIPVSHSVSVSTTANRHGHSKTSQVCVRCCSDNFVTSSLSERVRCGYTCSVDMHLTWCILRWYSFTVIATCVCKPEYKRSANFDLQLRQVDARESRSVSAVIHKDSSWLKGNSVQWEHFVFFQHSRGPGVL